MIDKGILGRFLQGFFFCRNSMYISYRETLLPPRYFMKVKFKKKNSHPKIAAAFLLLLFHQAMFPADLWFLPSLRTSIQKSQFWRSHTSRNFVCKFMTNRLPSISQTPSVTNSFTLINDLSPLGLIIIFFLLKHSIWDRKLS